MGAISADEPVGSVGRAVRVDVRALRTRADIAHVAVERGAEQR